MFLAPLWGGPSYNKSIENFTLDFLKPRDGYVVDVFVSQTWADYKFILVSPENRVLIY